MRVKTGKMSDSETSLVLFIRSTYRIESRLHAVAELFGVDIRHSAALSERAQIFMMVFSCPYRNVALGICRAS